MQPGFMGPLRGDPLLLAGLTAQSIAKVKQWDAETVNAAPPRPWGVFTRNSMFCLTCPGLSGKKDYRKIF
jgi:hypothetical protein